MTTMRRLFAGMTVVFGLSVWAWCRADGSEAEAKPAGAAQATAAEPAPGGNHDEAAYRFRTSQSHHWRQVMIGGH